MKRMVIAMMAAVLVSMQAIAQDENKQQREQRKFDKTEVVKHRTEQTVKRYQLNEQQAKQLLELNKQYADKIGPRGGRHHHGRPGGHHQMDMKGCCQDGKACQKDGKACECKDKKCQDMKGKKDKMKAQTEKRMKDMKGTMEAYDAELKKIMTDEQYKKYQEDRKAMRGKHHPRS